MARDYGNIREYEAAGCLFEVAVDYDAGDRPTFDYGGCPPSLDWRVVSLRVLDTDALLGYDPFRELDDRQAEILVRYLRRVQARKVDPHERVQEHLACELDDVVEEEVRADLNADFYDEW